VHRRIAAQGLHRNAAKMGIKFRCPNGHKLNVKSFLAGKKGVCPKCGTRMRIPSASTEGGDSDIEDNAAAVGVATPVAGVPVVGANGSSHPAPVASPAPVPAVASPAAAIVRPATAPIGVPLGVPAAAMPRPAMAMPAMPHVAPAPGMHMPPGPMPLPPAVAAGDPIAEAPAAQWYVRPPSGVQYGPARGDVMRKWIAEGRVSSDSLVWREGWADWKNAGQLFPHLGSAGGPSVSAPSSGLPSTTATRSANRYAAKKKSGSGLAVAFLIVLAVVCAGLVGVLVYVLTTAK
jgi:hypothetical protein